MAHREVVKNLTNNNLEQKSDVGSVKGDGGSVKGDGVHKGGGDSVPQLGKDDAEVYNSVIGWTCEQHVFHDGVQYEYIIGRYAEAVERLFQDGLGGSA